MKFRALSPYSLALLTGVALAPFTLSATPVAVGEPQVSSSQDSEADPLSLFAPAADRGDHRIDYKHWDEALGWFVVPMGPSIREGAPRVTPGTGTRFIYGHTSRYRLEGNKVAFSHMDSEIRMALTEYRQDLERIGTELDLTRLPRNEQLAFWMNLHNVAIVEALAHNYPLRDPSEGPFGSNSAGLQDAKLVTVNGVMLSPRDIREGIVYANWRDPKVMYGFWHGEIGGPSIQRLAFTGANVDQLLALSAEEFVNSLRGVEAFSGALRVSRIYEDAAKFYFADDDALRQHLQQFAGEDVKELLGRYERTAYNFYETDIADLVFGRPDTNLSFVCPANNFDIPLQSGSTDLDPAGTCQDQPTVPNRAEQRLMEERRQKLFKAYRRGIRTGMVIYGDGQYVEGETPPEVQ